MLLLTLIRSERSRTKSVTKNGQTKPFYIGTKEASRLRPSVVVYNLQLLFTTFSCCLQPSAVVYNLQLLFTTFSCCLQPSAVVYNLHVYTVTFRKCHKHVLLNRGKNV